MSGLSLQNKKNKINAQLEGVVFNNEWLSAKSKWIFFSFFQLIVAILLFTLVCGVVA